MKYSAINIQGNIITSEILEKIRTEDIRFQKSVDFGFDPNTQIRDEISLSWSLASSNWNAFQQKRENLLETDTGTTETRRMWVIPLMGLLGYDLNIANAEIINGKSYAISHRANNLDGFPIHIVGVNQSLDKRAESGGARLSPHALVQEYLNNHEHLFALVSNGRFLRILRDATKLSQLSYIEFDLELILEENLYAEFALLYRFLHSSRLPQTVDEGSNSIIEYYHQEAIESGARIRERLSEAVENSLKTFANGFLSHPENEQLRQRILEEKISARKFYQVNLRLVYRLLFLMVVEERKLIFLSSKEISGNEEIYNNFYSLHRLTVLAENLYYVDKSKKDLWLSLNATFKLFEDENFGKKLGIQPLGSGIFSPDALGELDGTNLDNENLLKALKFFTSFVNDNKQIIRVNYADLNVEELGSVYEGLLDLEPVFYNTEKEKVGELSFDFSNEGMDRKTTGSYYTSPELVNELIKSSLVPVINERLNRYKTKEEQIESLLNLKVCDPASGSGHMLLAAARTIAWQVASLRSDEEHPAPPVYRESLREVINHCLYAVDFNLEAVELCKLALWLEGHNAGKPLSFLDHKIRNGNSLVGVTDLRLIEKGIPNEAFKPITGDQKSICDKLKKENSSFLNRKQFSINFTEEKESLTKDFKNVENIDQNDLRSVKLAKQHFEESRSNKKAWFKTWTACNIWTASFFSDYTEANEKALPTSESLFNYIERPGAAYGPMIGNANSLSVNHKFFHWPLEFPDVYAQGGFDVMLGNPPWERIKLQEKEFFKGKNEKVVKASNTSKRKKIIQELQIIDPELFQHYSTALKTSESTSKFIRDSNIFPLTGRGDINTYSIFAELFSSRITKEGAAGFIVPTGIATDDNNKFFFAAIAENGRLLSFFDFENKKAIFPTVHRSFKFSLLSIGSPQEKRLIRFGFFLHDVSDLQDERQVFTLKKEDFLNINPNTKTTPVFRTRKDAELTAKIYSRVPILFNEEKQQDPWGINFMRMFDMSNDAGLFKTKSELEETDFVLKGNRLVKDKNVFLPLYESKMIWFYNHRSGSFRGIDNRNSTNSGTTEEYENPNYQILPWYWISLEEIEKRSKDKYYFGFRRITNNTNERSFVSTVLPLNGFGDNLFLLFSNSDSIHRQLLNANLSCIPFDFVVRQKLAGMNMNYFYVNQFPLLTRETYPEKTKIRILQIVLELYYTSWDIKAFADNLWKEANNEQKDMLKNQWEENKMRTGGNEWHVPDWSEAYPEIAWKKAEGCPLPPFKWDSKRRFNLKAELDAHFALLYGLEREELEYILDPKSVYGDDFPSETFRVLKGKEIKKFGEFRTQRLVLEAYDQLRPNWDMPKHLEKLKQIWNEYQVDLSQKKKTKSTKKTKPRKSDYAEEPSGNYKLNF